MTKANVHGDCWNLSEEGGFLLGKGGRFSRRDCHQAVARWQERFPLDQVRATSGNAILAIPGEYTLEALAFMLYALQNDMVVAPVAWDSPAREQLLQHLSPGWIWRGSADQCDGWDLSNNAKSYPRLRALNNKAGLVLATTGTTGERKWVLHRFREFFQRYANRRSKPVRVLPLMTPSHIGGQDIFWRALLTRATLVIPEDMTPEAVGHAVQEHQVQFLAATPSYLRGLYIRGVLDRYDWGSVQRITYGGERMPEALLSHLRNALPHVEWEQRYGLSELSAFSTRDAGDGYLQLMTDASTWQVRDGELWVKRPPSWMGYLGEETTSAPEEWFATGDRVEQREDGAIRILGRAGLFINVGGEKVSPEEVESVLLHMPDVLDCKAYPKRDPFMGQVVAVDIIVRQEERSRNWRSEVRLWCKDKLPAAAVPVHVKVMDSEMPEWRAKIDRRVVS